MMLLLSTLLVATGPATWSIIILDRVTGTVGVAAASCTSDVYGIVALAPGQGALVAQALGHPPAMREAVRLLRTGAAPAAMLKAVSAPEMDSALHDRQYGFATFDSGLAQFTGSALGDYRGERNGDGILVQGNQLAGPRVLDDAMEAIAEARAAGKPLEEVLLAGLMAGAAAGGDRRCGAQGATAAFVTVAKPGDNPTWPYLTLRVVDAPPGGVSAVDVLAKRLAIWKAGGGRRLRLTSETIRPDSTG
jgi:uncharacterized Ntn-hydrolase superfamily protein